MSSELTQQPSSSKPTPAPAPAPAPTPSKKVKVEDEDLDDLDDVLDEFNKPPPTKKPQSTSIGLASASESRPVHGPPLPPDDIPEDFAAQLAANMEELFKGLGLGSEMGVDVGTSGSDKPDAEFQKVWDQMMVKEMDQMFGGAEVGGEASGEGQSTGTGGAAGPSENKTKEKEVENKFQETIVNAIKRSQESDKSAKDHASNAASRDLSQLMEMLAGLGDLGDLGDLDNTGLDGDGGGGGIPSMLDGLMSQLMSKEVLYEPLKEINDKFPDYLSKNASQLTDEQKTRYEKQKALASRIVELFEKPNYSESDMKMKAEILDLMNQMQALGSPPSEIMGPLPDGWTFGDDGLPNLDSCPIA
jgi:peroxin-19